MTVVQERGHSVDGGREPTGRSVSFLAFTLRLTEPGGVTVPGKPGHDEKGERRQAQAVLDRDHRGRPQLPGTSLAGALRAMVAARDEAKAVDWFGPHLADGQAEAKASKVWVFGSELLGHVEVAELTSTRIDRWRGAAAVPTLRKEQLLPAGTRFEVFLRWDDAADGEVAELAALIAAWRPLIGRGTSRGRGRCVVESVRHGTLRLSDPGDLLLWLTRHGPDLAREVARQQTVDVPAESAVAADVLFRVPVRTVGPWRIGEGNKPEPGSQEPLRLLRAFPGGPPLVPGTAVKGVLRSRAEFILRSVGMTPEPCQDGCCQACWTCQVFGYGGGSDEDATSVGARAVLRFADTVVANPVEVAKPRPHIAIGRFTGGVRDRALYTSEALEAGEFTIAVELLSADVTEKLRGEIAALLRLVLDDLNDGIIGMGAATTRGYGSVRVEFDAAEGLPSAAGARRALAGMVRDSGA